MPERSFAAPWDSTTKAITAVTCVLLAFVAWMVHVVFVAPLFPLLIFLTYAYSPRGYQLTADAIVIKRLIGYIRVPLADVREIRAGTAADFTGVIRLWGNGGLFGYVGLFRTAKLGKSSWYVTNRSKTVIVVTSNKTLVLSPDDVEGFIEAAGIPRYNAETGVAPRVRASGNFAGIVAGIGIAAAAIVFGTLALVYAPGPPAYTLTADTLAIHDKFYPVTLRADAVDVGGIRIVDLTQETEWRPTLRTNGFANRNYQSGWFRVANGKTVRLYRAGGNRLVLIPPRGEGTLVLYQPKNPEPFAQELQQRWSGH